MSESKTKFKKGDYVCQPYNTVLSGQDRFNVYVVDEVYLVGDEKRRAFSCKISEDILYANETIYYIRTRYGGTFVTESKLGNVCKTCDEPQQALSLTRSFDELAKYCARCGTPFCPEPVKESTKEPTKEK